MAKPGMDLTAFVGKLLEEQDGDVLREGDRVLARAVASELLVGDAAKFRVGEFHQAVECA